MDLKQLIEAALLARASRKFTCPDEAAQFKGQSLLRMMEAIIPMERGELPAAYATRVMKSSDLPALLANVGTKLMQKAYEEQAPTYSVWCKVGTLTDFKQASLVQVSAFPSLQEPSAEGGDFATATISDGKETVQLKSYGVILEFSRQMLINDDLKVLADFASRAAAAAARNVESLAYSVLTTNGAMADTKALFHADHKNLAATGAAISIDTLGAGKAAMRKQTSPDGAKLNLAPKYLIVGPDLETVAAQYCSQAMVAAESGKINPFAGTLQLVVSAEITDKAWYLAADHSQIDTVCVFFLEGQEAPMIETREKFENSATQIKVTHDAAAVAADFRGLYKNPGETVG